MYLYSGVQINLRVNLNCVRMGFIARSIFVGKFVISGLKPVHLSFLYLQNKKRLLQGVHVDFGSRGESCNGHGLTLAVIQFPFFILSQGIPVKMPQES